MLNNTNVALVGAGQMAEAMIGGMLANNLVKREHVSASGPRNERMDKLAAEYGIRVSTSNLEAIEGADVIILAIKPQMAHQVLAELKGHVAENALVISIAAGLKISTMEKDLLHSLVVRAMPNTPGKINKGITIWTATELVTDVQRAQASQLLGSLGDEVFVEHERYLDMATALSGSGPMYVFLFMEALVDAGVRLGLPRYLAQKMVLQTTIGSAEYAQVTGSHLAQLRNDVTSPGGTSAEALFQLDSAGFRTALSKAVYAAFERSQELGKN